MAHGIAHSAVLLVSARGGIEPEAVVIGTYRALAIFVLGPFLSEGGLVIFPRARH